MVNYSEISYADISSIIPSNLILVVTATDLETSLLHEQLDFIVGHQSVLKVSIGSITAFLGKLGQYNIVHVQTSMGSIARDSSIMTVSAALKSFQSNVVIMIGIAFGVDSDKQKIGDVLIAESIIPYNIRRVGNKNSIQRGIEAPSSKILFNRFKNIKQTWQHIIDGDSIAELITTRMLSGEELIDNLEHRNALISNNPDSKGGEMEGVGVYSACDGLAEWILVKGICDFADGEKGKNKALNQTVAMESALSACLAVFNSPSAFESFNIVPCVLQVDAKEEFAGSINDILFDVYEPSKEAFYIDRKVDVIFNKTLFQYGIWVFGPTGCGKSNLILRNLEINKKDFLQISLASCIGMEIDVLFKEIYFEISSKAEGVKNIIEPNSFTECSKLIVALLNNHYNGMEFILFIEEIPLSTEEEFKVFADKLFSIIFSKNLVSGLEKIKFVLSSINNPTNNIKLFQQKIFSQLNFFPLKYWENPEVQTLMRVIEQNTKIILTDEQKIKILSASKGSPRFIKKVYRNVNMLRSTDDATIDMIILEVSKELNQLTNV